MSVLSQSVFKRAAEEKNRQAAAKQMASQGVRGSIVLTSSILGFFALPGYAAYTPAKHAIRGLAETLRAELLMYGISVHAYFPATILSPGYEEEEKCKPQLTKDIEGADGGLTPEQCAERLVKGQFPSWRLPAELTTIPASQHSRRGSSSLRPTRSVIFSATQCAASLLRRNASSIPSSPPSHPYVHFSGKGRS